MLKVVAQPHRAELHANHNEPQKVFVMLKLIPSPEVATQRPPLAVALVVDTSASMRAFVDQSAAQSIAQQIGGNMNMSLDGSIFHGLDSDLPTLLHQAIDACHTMLDDQRLLPTDQVTIIHFDDRAEVLLPLTPLTERAKAHAAVEEMRKHAGGTRMAGGLSLALEEVKRAAPEAARRIFLLTDGAASDEKDCRALLPELEGLNAPVISIGFGIEYDEKLLAQIAQASRGRPYHLQEMKDLSQQVLEREIGQSTREVVTDLRLDVVTPKGVRLDRINRAHPALTEIILGDRPFRLGNIAAGDFTVFIIELTVETPRAQSRARLAQIKLSGTTPSGQRDLPPYDVVVEFTENKAATVNAEVIGYVQQKNVANMIDSAMRDAEQNPAAARQTLQSAANMTRSLGNNGLSQMIGDAASELETTGQISAQTLRTVALGTRTRTVKTSAVDSPGNSATGGLSAEELRRLSGT